MLGCGHHQRLVRRVLAASPEQRALAALLLLLLALNIPWRFCTSHYAFLPAEELAGRLVRQCVGPGCPAAGAPPLCPAPRTLPSAVVVDESAVSDSALARLGLAAPHNCTPPFRVSVVVPYRARPGQLRIFLRHMHPLLRSQRLSYTIYIVEQSGRRPFNRGKLLNVGFAEAANDSSAADDECFIFHDVDLLPEDAGNVYACTRRPRHLSARVSSMRYQLPYPTISGGVLAVLGSTFRRVNGYSNAYFGWGGEDDDFSARLSAAGEVLVRPDPRVSRYTMLRHRREEPSGDRMHLLREAPRRAGVDGLTSLKYTVLEREDRGTYQWIRVDL